MGKTYAKRIKSKSEGMMCYGICRYENRDGECAKKTKHYPSDGACVDDEEEYEARKAHEDMLEAMADHLLDQWKEEGKPKLWRGRIMP